MTNEISFQASYTAPSSTAYVTITGTSGLLTHSQTIRLTVQAATAHVGLNRTRYIRTDAVTPYPFTINSGWEVFDPNTRRFFISDPADNQIEVFDAATETRIASIVVPGAYGIDESPDHSVLYAGTMIGDVYAVDPVTMTVKRRYPASQIGPYGYPAVSARVLANGELALLGNLGVVDSVDGAPGFAVWDPSTNSIMEYGSDPLGRNAITQPNCVSAIGAFTLTGDRSLIVEASIDSDDTLCTIDPVTGAEHQTVVSDGGQSSALDTVAPSPDGNLLVVPFGYASSVVVYNAKTLEKISSFPVAGDTSGDATMLVSADSKTLYIADENFVYAYDLASGQLTGWTPNLGVWPLGGGFVVGGGGAGPELQAIDGTGLIAGPMEEGVGFIDTSAMQTSPLGTPFLDAFVNPATGSIAGGTAVQWFNGSSLGGAPSAVYFGANQATGLSGSLDEFSAVTPPGNPGPVDVYSLTADGGEEILPEAFSYGPSIIEATPDAMTAEGGGTGILYGYGFGSTSVIAPIPTDLTVTIGGKAATILGYTGNAYNADTPPFPLEAIAYTIPPGTAGTAADIVVTSSSGSWTLAGGMHYLPASARYPLPGSSLAQGVFDPHRDVYYFTDTDQIRVFSRTGGGWLTSIPMPAPPTGTSHRLWGIALSPDGNTLAVSDTGTAMIYVLDPDTPASVKAFAVAGLFSGGYQVISAGTHAFPAGLAVSDTGVVYYAAYFVGGSGYDGYFALDTTTGAVTDFKVHPNGNSPMAKVVLSSDGTRAYSNNDGDPFMVNTATGAVTRALFPQRCCFDLYDATLAPNQTEFESSVFLFDNNLNANSFLTLNLREAMNTTYVNGAKFSADGTLMFQPSVAGIDVFDGRVGSLLGRIALPYPLSPNFDALVSDGTDNVLVAITGKGDGLSILDLTRLVEPGPLPYARPASPVPQEWLETTGNPAHSVYPASTKISGSDARWPLSRIPFVPGADLPHSTHIQ